MLDSYFHFRLYMKSSSGINTTRDGFNYNWLQAKTLVEQLGASAYTFFPNAGATSLSKNGRSSDVWDFEIVRTGTAAVDTIEKQNVFTRPDRIRVDRREFLEPPKARRVFVVHGRNVKLLEQLTRFLDGLGLSTVTWNDAIRATQSPSPYVLDIVTAGMNEAQAVVVLLTPDEDAGLRPEYGGGAQEGQPRANVLVEAGMAIARDRTRTILVQVGEIRSWSDFNGILLARLDRESGRANLRTCLENAQCIVEPAGDWASRGRFVA